MMFGGNVIVMGCLQAGLWATIHASKKRRMPDSMMLEKRSIILLYLGIAITPIAGAIMIAIGNEGLS